MKLFLFASLMMCLQIIAFAQSVEINPNSSAFLSKFDANGNLYKDVNPTVKGTPFLSEQMGHGFAVLANGNRFSSFDLQFDLVANELYFVMGEKLYRFTSKVKQAQIKYPSAEDSVLYTIRGGYPAAGAQSNTSLYLVLEDGPRFQLLSYSKKVKVDVANYGSSLTSEYKLNETMYLFDVAQQKLSELTRKSVLTDFIPADKADLYLKTNKKPRDRDDWKAMVRLLNAE